jgi:hypothetical protein
MAKRWKNAETEFVHDFLVEHSDFWHDFRPQVENILGRVPDERFVKPRKTQRGDGKTVLGFRPGAETVLSQLIHEWVKANVDHNLWLRGRRKSATVFPYEKLVDMTLESRVDWMALAAFWLGRIRTDVELESMGG